MHIRTRSLSAVILGSLCLMASTPAVRAQQAVPGSAAQNGPSASDTGEGPIRYPQSQSWGLKGLTLRTLGDAKAYFTAPIHWHARQWEYFGGALAAIAAAHHYDTQVRTHFVGGSTLPYGPKPKSSSTFTDALPGFAAFAATWG